MSLRKYIEKRNFKVTPEPKPETAKKSKKTSQKAKSSKALKYVIQKHAASHLHYDLRLEIHGAMKSWAVPKGPSLDPSVKHLAVETEDHPMEYNDFEGIIPQGEYGGGTVMVWDQGTYSVDGSKGLGSSAAGIPRDGNPEKAYRKGDITFEIQGKKLKGKWKLIKMRSRNADQKIKSKILDGAKEKNVSAKNQWLFFKITDAYARKDYDITKEMPRSVLTKRTMEQIAADAGEVWESHKTRKTSEPEKDSLQSRIRKILRAQQSTKKEPTKLKTKNSEKKGAKKEAKRAVASKGGKKGILDKRKVKNSENRKKSSKTATSKKKKHE